MTIREALANAKIDSLDAYLLLSFSLSQRRKDAESNYNRTKLLAMGEEIISKDEYDFFRSLIDRRKNGECVAYITGKKEFWGLEFEVTPAVLVPRPETELLVETSIKICTALREPFALLVKKCKALTRINKENIRILDLCTGSGAIAIALKHELPDLEIVATDISHDALEVAKINAERLLPNKDDITFLQGDLYNALHSSHCSLLIANYSLILSNPPYIPASEIQTLAPEVQNEPHIALAGGETGTEIIERIVNDAPNYLINGGYLLIEINSRPGFPEKTKDIFTKKGFKDIVIYKDLAGLDRVIGGKFEK